MKKLLVLMLFFTGSVFSQQHHLYYEYSLEFQPFGDHYEFFSYVEATGFEIFNVDLVDDNGNIPLTTGSKFINGFPYEITTEFSNFSSGQVADASTLNFTAINQTKTTTLILNQPPTIQKAFIKYYTTSIMSLSQPIETNDCGTININATKDHPTEAYNWQFQGLTDAWQDVPLQQGQENITLSLEGLYGANANLYLNTPIRFRIYNQYGDYDSNIVPYTFIDCSPGLVQDPPTPIPPKCSNSNDGSVNVQFDRPLASNERMLLYTEVQLTDNSWDYYNGTNPQYLTSAEINTGNNNTYIWEKNLPPGNYRLRYISKYDTTGDIDPTPDLNNPNSDELSQEFLIIAPTQVTFSSSKTDILCYNNNDGSITINAQGGSGTSFQYSIDNGTSWQSTNTFTNLSAATYNLLARDGKSCVSETGQQVIITTPSTPFTLIANIINDPSANGVSDGNISIDVLGGAGTLNFQWKKDGTNFATTQNITGLGVGIYTVTATDANSCVSNTLTFTLQEPPPLTVTFTLIQGIDCNGDTGSITAQGIGGSSANDNSYTYLWNNGATDQNLLNVSANTYTVTVTDSNGATVTGSYNLVEPPSILVTSTATDVLCNGGSDGAVTLGITGGTGAYTISWADDNTINSPNRTDLSFGEYFYNISDANNCSINGSVQVLQPAALVITESRQHPTAAGATDGSITISVAGGTGPYTYQWIDENGILVGNTEDIFGLGQGTYTLVVKDANFTTSTTNSGCESTITVSLVEPQNIVLNIIETQSVSCQGNDGILTAEVTGGVAPYTYQWLQEQNSVYVDLNLNTPSISNLSAGNYRLIVTDSNTIQAQSDATLAAPDDVVVNPTSTNILCNGNSDGTISLNITGGTTPYLIEWTDTASNSPNRTNLSKGTYNYTITDDLNCSTTGSIEITEPAQVSITIDDQQNPSSGNATDGFINVTVSGGTSTYTYEWKNSNGVIIATTEDIIGLGIDTYALTVRDANYNTITDIGCEASINITLTNPNVLSVVITESQNLLCFGGTNGSLTALANGGIEPYVYQWFKQVSGNFVNLNQNVAEASNLSAGNYRVIVTDNNVDQVQLDYTLVQPEEIVVNSTISNISCNGSADGTVVLNATGGTGNYSINWLDDNTITSFNRTNLDAGEYFYTITDDNGCSTDSSITINEPTPINVTVVNKQNPSTLTANDGSIDISVSGGTPPYVYEWNNSNGDVIATTEDISGLGVDNYTLTVRDANYNTIDDIGCETSITIILSDPTVLSVSITETQSISCFGDSNGILIAEVISGANPYTYQWLKQESGNYVDLNLNTSSIENLTAGDYRVIVSDNTSATAQSDFTLTEPIAIQMTSTVQNISCLGSDDGSIDITVIGGTEPFSFSWKNENGFEVSTSEDLVNFIAGTYNVSITDANGCILENNIEISGPVELLEINLDELQDPSAFGANDGFVNINITGGVAPYVFEWRDNTNTIISTEEDLSNAGEGVYTLTIVDNNGCSVSEQFALLSPNELNITINESISILCFGSKGELQVFVTGGVLNSGSDYTYQWFKEENGSFINLNNSTNILSEIEASTYRITVKDDSNIEKSLTYNLISPDTIIIALAITNSVSCSSGADGVITSTITGGSPPYTYLWNNGEETETLTDLSVGTYTLTITDNNDCIVEASIDLTQPDGMSIESEVITPSCNNDNDGSISLRISGGTTPYNYLWNTGATTSNIENLSAGEFSVTITDAVGCIAIQNFILENPEPLIIELGENRTLCLDQQLELDATIEDAGATYQWTSDNGFSSTSPIVVLEDEGVYSLTVINSNGCSATDNIEITTTNEIISANFLVPTQAFENETIVLVDVSNPVPDTVNWTFSEGTTIVSQNGDYAELMFEKEGVYTATMVSKRGTCEAILTKEIIVQASTNFGNTQNPHATFIQEFTIFPNPNSGVFKAEVTLLQSASISLKIVNLATNAIVNTKIASGKEHYVFDYNLNLAIGVYMVMLETPKGSQVRKVIIK